jgi:hypothetical protein
MIVLWTHRFVSTERNRGHDPYCGVGRCGDTACGSRVSVAMIGLPAGTQIWIAAGMTDLRRGFTGLSGMEQTVLHENPFSGHVFLFRGLCFDGDGLCLFAN